MQGVKNMFKHKLKELRKSHGYTMDELATLYNNKFGGKLNKSTISRYENGLQEPLITVVKNFAQLFNVSLDYLIDETPEPSLDEQLEGVEFALWGEVKDLSDDEKQDILDFIKFKKTQRKE